MKPTNPELNAALDYIKKAKRAVKKTNSNGGKLHPLLQRFSDLCERIKKKGDEKLTAEGVLLLADMVGFFTAAAYLEKFNRAIIDAGNLIAERMNEREPAQPTTKTNGRAS